MDSVRSATRLGPRIGKLNPQGITSRVSNVDFNNDHFDRYFSPMLEEVPEQKVNQYGPAIFSKNNFINSIWIYINLSNESWEKINSPPNYLFKFQILNCIIQSKKFIYQSY